MKSLLVLLLAVSSLTASAQQNNDRIVLLSGDTVPCLITNVGKTSIYYQQNNSNTQILAIKKVLFFQRADGPQRFPDQEDDRDLKLEYTLTSAPSKSLRKQLQNNFMDSILTRTSKQEIKNLQMYGQGKYDASQYYEANGGMFVVLGVYFGLPIIYMATIPKELRTIHNPNNELLDEPIYYEGYKRGVRKKKLGKLLKGGLICCAGTIAFVVAVLKSLN